MSKLPACLTYIKHSSHLSVQSIQVALQCMHLIVCALLFCQAPTRSLSLSNSLVPVVFHFPFPTLQSTHNGTSVLLHISKTRLNPSTRMGSTRLPLSWLQRFKTGFTTHVKESYLCWGERGVLSFSVHERERVCVCVYAFVPVRGWANQDVSVIIKTLFMKEQSRGLFCGYVGLFGGCVGFFRGNILYRALLWICSALLWMVQLRSAVLGYDMNYTCNIGHHHLVSR